MRAATVMFEDGLVTLGKFILTYLDISFIVRKLYGFIPIRLSLFTFLVGIAGPCFPLLDITFQRARCSASHL